MRTREIAQGGILTALSVVLLALGSLVEIAGGAAAMLASLVPAVFYLRGQDRTAVCSYLATSVLGWLIVPDKFVVLVYSGVLGLYTVCRFPIGRLRPRWKRLLARGLMLAFWYGLTIVLIRLGVLVELGALSPLLLVGLAVGWVAFLVYYDFCMTRIIAGLGRLLCRFDSRFGGR